MPTKRVPALVSQPEPIAPIEIPELTDAYRKAHKNYVLASGLLASWELIGITIQTKERWGIELKSPAAVPLILFTLVIYFGYTMTIEWLQCNPERKKNRAAKLDYHTAHGIAIVAIGIPIIQYSLRIQIVDVLIRHPFSHGLGWVAISAVVLWFTFSLFAVLGLTRDQKQILVPLLIAGLGFVLSLVGALFQLHKILIGGLSLSALTPVLVLLLAFRQSKRKAHEH